MTCRLKEISSASAGAAATDRYTIDPMAIEQSRDVIESLLGWMSARCEQVDVVTMSAGRVVAPPNVRVFSVGKEKGYSEPRRALGEAKKERPAGFRATAAAGKKTSRPAGRLGPRGTEAGPRIRAGKDARVRPGTPQDQAWIESLFSHIKADWPHLDQIRDPAVLRAELVSVRDEYNTTRLHAGIGYVTPADELTPRSPPRAPGPGWSSRRCSAATRPPRPPCRPP